MSRPIRVAILGARGYGAGELLRLLVQHPAAEVVCITSTSQVDEPLASVHPHLAGFYDLRVVERVDYDALFSGDFGVVIAALPHGASGPAADRVLSEVDARREREKLRIIDLSGDLRLRDATLHRRYYPETPELPSRRGTFVYGLPELDRDSIRTAHRIANPGCLATSAILAAAPLVCSGFSGPVAVDAKTGSSGSGRQLKDTTHHPTRHADFRAYKALEHQHEGEILQAWKDPSGQRIGLSFVAQSMDVTRGIFATVHLTMSQETNTVALREQYRTFYAGSPFVRLRDESPTLQDVVGSNFCDISVACRGHKVIAMAALDNLVKGMAGAAIQNMNLMCGLPETAGLWTPSLRPL
ncbi:N-acetyl-gamma-glutamyl-phosphate reductase [Phycisphaerae bacterium RAS1]|nr:N-acetyl-gamma-glutamyl-phosphate reductase [Phycisphaerae bacterium RAS1]